MLNSKRNLSEGSLLKMTWVLPNGADKNFTFSGDFLFLRTPLLNELLDIEDSILWGNDSKWDTIKHWILTFIFKSMCRITFYIIVILKTIISI